MPKRLLIVIFALWLTAGPLSAGELSSRPQRARPRMTGYVGVGLTGEVEGGAFRDRLETLSDAGGDPWKLFAGWRLGRYLAVEVGRHDLGVQRCCELAADLGFRTRVDGFSAAALGRWPAGRFAPFVKAGALAWEEDGELITFAGPVPGSADGTDLLLGAGVDVDLPARFAVRADWERYEFAGTSSDGLWASLLYRF